MSDESEMHEPAGAYSPPAEPAAPEPWSHPWHDQLGLRYHQAIANLLRNCLMIAQRKLVVPRMRPWLRRRRFSGRTVSASGFVHFRLVTHGSLNFDLRYSTLPSDRQFETCNLPS